MRSVNRTVARASAILVGLGLVCLTGAAQDGPAGGDGPAKVRIGTYDARAIAVAYAASEFHSKELAAKQEEMKKAEAGGDKKRVEQLKAWGKAHQRQMHRQGFGGAPVSDLLAHVKDRLPEVAAKAGVTIVMYKADYVGDNVETVDLTDELVKLFSPNERTLKIVKDLRKHPPISIEEADNIED